MSKIIQIKCSSCGATISPDQIHGTILYCDYCKRYSILDNHRNILKCVFYKILPFKSTIYDYKKELVSSLSELDANDIFDHLKLDSPVQRFYLPVREIRSNDTIKIVPLNTQYSDLDLSAIDYGLLNNNGPVQERLFKDLRTTDYKPLYIKEKKEQVEFLPINESIDKIDALYDADKEDLLIIKYLPLSILQSNLGQIIAVGDIHPYILNKDSIIKGLEICRGKISKNKELWSSIKRWILGLICITVLVAVVYKIFTVGITFGSILSIIGSIITILLMVLWAGIWIGMYAIGAFLIFAPPLFLIWNIFKFKKPEINSSKNPIEKGYKIFEIS